MLQLINQIFEIEQKLLAKNEILAERNFKRITYELELMGFRILNPIGRRYQETDTDLEVTLSGSLKGALKVTRVLKPVIYQQTENGETLLLQKGIVIVEGA
jgi:hypothetical protein